MRVTCTDLRQCELRENGVRRRVRSFASRVSFRPRVVRLVFRVLEEARTLFLGGP